MKEKTIYGWCNQVSDYNYEFHQSKKAPDWFLKPKKAKLVIEVEEEM